MLRELATTIVNAVVTATGTTGTTANTTTTTTTATTASGHYQQHFPQPLNHILLLFRSESHFYSFVRNPIFLDRHYPLVSFKGVQQGMGGTTVRSVGRTDSEPF